MISWPLMRQEVASSTATGVANTATATLAATKANNLIMVAAFVTDDPTGLTITAPTGMTQQIFKVHSQNAAQGPALAVWTKIAAGGETACTVTTTNNARIVVEAFEFQNIDTTTPIDGVTYAENWNAGTKGTYGANHYSNCLDESSKEGCVSLSFNVWRGVANTTAGFSGGGYPHQSNRTGFGSGATSGQGGFWDGQWSGRHAQKLGVAGETVENVCFQTMAFPSPVAGGAAPAGINCAGCQTGTSLAYSVTGLIRIRPANAGSVLLPYVTGSAANASIVRQNTGNGNTTSVSVTITSPTNGNVLFAAITVPCNSSTDPTSVASGWRRIPSDKLEQATVVAGSRCKTWCYYKISNGGETAFTCTTNALDASSSWVGTVWELSGVGDYLGMTYGDGHMGGYTADSPARSLRTRTYYVTGTDCIALALYTARYVGSATLDNTGTDNAKGGYSRYGASVRAGTTEQHWYKRTYSTSGLTYSMYDLPSSAGWGANDVLMHATNHIYVFAKAGASADETQSSGGSGSDSWQMLT